MARYLIAVVLACVGTLGGAALGGAVGNEAGRRYEERQK